MARFSHNHLKTLICFVTDKSDADANIGRPRPLPKVWRNIGDRLGIVKPLITDIDKPDILAQPIYSISRSRAARDGVIVKEAAAVVKVGGGGGTGLFE